MNLLEIVLIAVFIGIVIFAVVQIAKGNTGSCGGDCAACRRNCKNKR
ncbi:MAG: FeoB-associated Cys-rich membrane protein [Christensenellaceae bacterium]|nr:FeoB-associated Cys-rich membrane protein [Christensenellaceae bacterium]MBR3841802.1 FeoB-associated Cys-rich membrane protein [Christensenellaceae bacterium]